jgi:hypothetical protein
VDLFVKNCVIILTPHVKNFTTNREFFLIKFNFLWET